MITHAIVQLDRPLRYAKQLVSHLSRKCAVADVPDGKSVTIAPEGQTGGVGQVLVRNQDADLAAGELLMVAESDSAEGLALVEDVLARHLVRFYHTEGLQVDWQDGPLSR